MEKAFATKDLYSFECLSPSELDRKFYEEHSLLSAMSLEQLSTSRTSTGIAAEGSDAVSPFRSFPPGSLNPQDADNFHLAVPLQGKSSTPQVLLLKPARAACQDQSCGELSALQTSWDVSLIKSESNSPRPRMESSAAEPTCSPRPQLHSLVEVSP